MYPIIAKIKWYYCDSLNTDYIILYATSLAEATKEIEKNFQDVESVEVTIIDSDNSYFYLSEATYNHLKENGNDNI